MKIAIENAFASKLAGLDLKNENEVWGQDADGDPCTFEFPTGGADVAVVRYYHENGQIRWEKHYQSGQLHGQQRGYYLDGQLEWEAYHQNGQRHGQRRGYYENGQLWLERHYQNGQLHGQERYYYKNGQLAWEEHYQNGQMAWEEHSERHIVK